MELYIRNMVSLRCKIVVRQILSRMAIDFESVELGYIKFKSPLPLVKQRELANRLERIELYVICDQKQVIAEHVKNIVSGFSKEGFQAPKLTYSNVFEQQIKLPYYYISRIFREVSGITIEKYIILYKIERVKELLEIESLSLTDIAFRLDYSSVAHLSRQFKDITGSCVKTFRRRQHMPRLGLDHITATGVPLQYLIS
ncbi:MAG: AraC family transcriptional regulator [Flavobacterium sp.]|nr:MAG: AraC family transcriptional regulator [Flavobacterium sp.]